MSYPTTDNETSEVIGVSGTQFDIKKFIYKLISFLPWIILSVLIAYAGAKIYLRYTPQVHRISANLLIKDEEDASPENNILRELGVMPGSKEIQNQIDILQSYELAENVVDSLNLQVNIISQGRITSSLLYGHAAPFFIKPIGKDTIEFKPDSYIVYLHNADFELVKNGKSITKLYNDSFKLGGKTVILQRNSKIAINPDGYVLSIRTKRSVALAIAGAITVTKLHEMSGVLEIAMLDESPQKAIDIINTLIKSFNTAGISDKKEVGYKTSKFLTERVDSVAAELDQLELKAEAFKRDNKINDISAQGTKYLDQALDYDEKQTAQQGQLELLASLEKFIANAKDYTDIIPSQYGLNEPTLTGLIAQYNQSVGTYQEQAKISTQKDPVMGRLKNQLQDIKGNLLKNITSIRQSYQIVLKQIAGKQNNFEQQFSGFPEMERQYLKLKRQIGVKEQLYLYLLQKKEETELSLVSTINDTRVIESAFDKGIILPKADQVMLFAILIGLILPVIAMLLLDFFDNKIADRKEVEAGTRVPIIGELSYNPEVRNKLVNTKSRSSLAEQFRLIGTNIRFIAPDKTCKTILVTSFMSGEGKSFVSINLASSLVSGNAKVLLIEMDLRKPKMLQYLNTQLSNGLTNYIINDIPIANIIGRVDNLPNVDVISSGPMPPNPAELLMHKKVDDLLAYAREHYQYIIIDSPPVGLVADVFLLTKHIDITLFILRHKHSFKTTIQFIEKLHTEQKVNALNVVVNGIKDHAGIGYGYGYGYSYGYGYHYGSGYYSDDKKPKGWKRFLKWRNK
ncbi:GumC family protein [Limnovirga soli]|uniref:non-specific protein-tyrosine kinase n=1 Tax=Limnovirga soli TaxID=2656915 RepID=A0A8J8FF66_9BACT|nr:tyrosine-protein kinase [Limnovirga soli]NNV56575.1 polysaccharide biosynthesis tyrosine autokinase [Limnovirga soli]